MGLQRVGHDWVTFIFTFTVKRRWQNKQGERIEKEDKSYYSRSDGQSWKASLRRWHFQEGKGTGRVRTWGRHTKTGWALVGAAGSCLSACCAAGTTNTRHSTEGTGWINPHILDWTVDQKRNVWEMMHGISLESGEWFGWMLISWFSWLYHGYGRC